MRPLDELFAALSHSDFRQRFHLRGSDQDYLHAKGLATIMAQARDLIAQRLAPAFPPNDGKQTPFRGHPMFVAQHATATCCRGCLEHWHRIPRGQALTAEEEAHVLAVLQRWLCSEFEKTPAPQRTARALEQLPLQWRDQA